MDDEEDLITVILLTVLILSGVGFMWNKLKNGVLNAFDDAVDTVKGHPWIARGAALGVAFLLGVWVG